MALTHGPLRLDLTPGVPLHLQALKGAGRVAFDDVVTAHGGQERLFARSDLIPNLNMNHC